MSSPEPAKKPTARAVGFQLVKKVVEVPRVLRRSLAEFRRPQTTESNEVCFFRGHAPRKKHCSACKRASGASATQQAAALRARTCTRESACRQSRQAQSPRHKAVGFVGISISTCRPPFLGILRLPTQVCKSLRILSAAGLLRNLGVSIRCSDLL